MYNAKPPPQLILTDCLDHKEAWREWYTQFTAFLKASGGDKGGSDVKTGLLLELIGPKGYAIFSSFMFEKNEDGQDFEKLVQKFNEYFTPKQCSAVMRYNFFSRNQEKDENIDDYVAALRSLAAQCRFDNLEEGLIRDRIVCGIWNNDIRRVLLETEDLDLEKTLEICSDKKTGEEKLQSASKASGDVSTTGVALDRLSSRRGRGYRRRLATSIRFTNWSSTC